MNGAARCLAAIVFVAASPAGAQDQPARTEAEGLFRDGNHLLREGDYAGALQLYERAYARLPSPRILVNMATAKKALGRRAEAADLYARVLAAPAGEVSEESREEARRIQRDLDIELGRVQVLVAVEGARVRVDDRDVGTTPLPAPVHVEPGEHVISVERDGFRAATSRAVVSAGEIVDVSVVLVEIPAATDPGSVTTAEADPAPSGAESVVATWWFWTGVTVIVAGVIVGGVVIAGGS